MEYKNKQEIYLDYQNGKIDIFQLIKAFDFLTSTQNKAGVVYTPGHIAQFMVAKAQPQIHQKMIELCVGHGVFVFAVLQYFKQQGIKTKHIVDFVENRLYAHDIVPQSIQEFLEILQLFMTKEFNVKKIKPKHVYAKNSLEYIQTSERFDLSLGNPPYIRFQNLPISERKFLQDNFSSCSQGNVDIYFAFLELAAKISTQALHIVPNSYLKNKSARNLRNLLKDTVFYIKDFKSEQVFETVGVYASIIGTLNPNDQKTFTFAYEQQEKTIPRDLLSPEEWNLENLELLQGVSNKKHKFIDLVNFYSGLATLADGLFILKTKPVAKVIPVTVNGETYNIELGATKKYLKVSKVKTKSDIAKFTYRIIYPYDSKGKILPEIKFKKLYPEAYRYLKDHRSQLDARDKGKVDKYESWYAYGRRQGFPAKYQGTVVLIPGMISQNSNYITLNNAQDYLFGSGYFLQPKAGFSLAKLSQALGSQDFFNYLSVTGKVWKGKVGQDYYSPNKKVILGYSFE